MGVLQLCWCDLGEYILRAGVLGQRVDGRLSRVETGTQHDDAVIAGACVHMTKKENPAVLLCIIQCIARECAYYCIICVSSVGLVCIVLPRMKCFRSQGVTKDETPNFFLACGGPTAVSRRLRPVAATTPRSITPVSRYAPSGRRPTRPWVFS